MMDLTPTPGVPRRKKNRRKGGRHVEADERGSAPWRVVLGWAVAMMAATGVALGVVHGWQALKGSARLQVRSVEYEGLSRATAGELSVYTGVNVGDGILDLDLDAMARALTRHPWVARAQVRRQLPDKINIVVREYEPAVLVALNEIYLANADGELFKRMAAGDGVLLPIVTGLVREDAQKEPESLRTHIQDAVALVHALAKSKKRLGRVDELHHDPDTGWSVVVNQLKEAQSVRLHLGKQPTRRIELAASALERARAKNLSPTVIWADGQKHPQRVHMRVRHAELAALEPLIAKAR
jgi:cell division protein FtsQ